MMKKMKFFKEIFDISSLESKVLELERKNAELEAKINSQDEVNNAIANAIKMHSLSIKMISDAIKKLISEETREETRTEDDTYH